LGRAPRGRGPRALFDDDEARRQIFQLRNQVDARQKAIEERLSAIERAARAAGFLRTEPGRRSRPADRIAEAGRGQAARQIEVLSNQTRPRAAPEGLYVDLDNRLRKLEQTQSQLQDKLSQGERSAAAEKQAYELALNSSSSATISSPSRASEFHDQFREQRAPALGAVLDRQRVLRDARLQVRHRRPAEVVKLWPENSKAPDALLNIASSQGELGKAPPRARTLRALVKNILQPGGRAGQSSASCRRIGGARSETAGAQSE